MVIFTVVYTSRQKVWVIPNRTKTQTTGMQKNRNKRSKILSYAIVDTYGPQISLPLRVSSSYSISGPNKGKQNKSVYIITQL